MSIDEQTVSIGVTGHRVLAEIEKVTAGVELALRRIEERHPGKQFVVYSSLAEGADRLVARLALARAGTRLVAPLPLPPDDYMADFGSPESRREFKDLLSHAEEVVHLPVAATREDSYNRASDYVLDHADALIAVWDGQPAQGRAGTAHVVECARRQRRRIAWVHAGNRKPGTMEPTSLGTSQGTVTYEGF